MVRVRKSELDFAKIINRKYKKRTHLSFILKALFSIKFENDTNLKAADTKEERTPTVKRNT